MSSLRRMGYLLGKEQTRKPWLFVIGAIILTLALLPGIPMLFGNVEPSLEKVLPQDLPEVKLMNDMRSQYSADMFYIVLTTDGDILDASAVRYMDRFSQRLRGTEHIVAADSVADVVAERNGGRLPLGSEEVRSLAESDPRTALYVSHDRSLAIIQVTADTGASASSVKAVLRDIASIEEFLASSNPGLEVRVTGFGAIDAATFSVIRSDFLMITGVSFAVMILFLLLHYRFSVKKTVYSFVIMMLALLWALGLSGYLGLPLNVVTMVAAAMIMALGSSYGINSVYHFYDDFLLQYERREAVARFQEFLIVGLTGSALAEIAAFIALLFGLMPSMHALGIMLAIGIFFALVASVLVLPVLFYLLERDTHGH